MGFTELLSKMGDKILLYRGISKDGRDFYCYFRSNERQYFRMKHDSDAGIHCVDSKEYGNILYTGFGHEPDDAAKTFLKAYHAAM